MGEVTNNWMPLRDWLSDPKRLFLIDGVGALLSAFLLGIVFVSFEATFGMPREALYVLATFPVVFAIYDFICYVCIKTNWQPFLRVIAIANWGYCCVSIGFMLQHGLTCWGWLYFLLELIIVAVLAGIEFKIGLARE